MEEKGDFRFFFFDPSLAGYAVFHILQQEVLSACTIFSSSLNVQKSANRVKELGELFYKHTVFHAITFSSQLRTLH